MYTFINLKAGASGYPAWVRTDKVEDRYLNTFFETEVVRPDKDGIQPNAANRGIAKLCHNSM
jgi:hypothetical protein